METLHFRKYQQNAYREIAKLLKSYGCAQLWADPGLGKTAIAARAMLDDMGPNDRMLVLAPKRVATDVWAQEFALWARLRDVPIAVVAGRPRGERIRAYFNRRVQVVVTNYDTIPLDFDAFTPENLPFTHLLCDEVDKIKSVSTRRFRIMRTWAPRFRRRLTMTGTPGSEGLLDLWTQAYICRPGVLGTSFNRWKNVNFHDIDWNGYKKAPNQGAFEATMRVLEPFTVRIDADDHLDVPEAIIKAYQSPLPPKLRKIYDDLEQDLIARLDESDDASVIETGSVHQKLRQLASGFYYDDDKNAQWLDKTKFTILDELLSEVPHHQVLLVYHYKAQLEELRERYPGLPYLGGGVSDAAARDAIVGWNAGRHRLMAIHPASASHGLNLQLSGAHHLVFMTMPYSSREYTQTVARLRRMGQRNVVVEHRILAPNTVDFDAVVALRAKDAGSREILTAMRERRGIR